MQPLTALLRYWALVVLLAGSWMVPAHSSAAHDPALKQCKQSCKQAKGLCNTQAKTHLQSLLGECTGSGPSNRQCRKQAKNVGKRDRADCKDFKRTCTRCCSDGTGDCAARCGDETVTSARGEQCDPPGSSCGARGTCNDDCRCSADVATTTTIVVPSTTTSSSTNPPTTTTTVLASTTTTSSTTSSSTSTTTTAPPSTTTTSTVPTTTTSSTSSPVSTTTSTSVPTTTSTTLPNAGLGLVMVATPDPVDQGDILTYQLTVTNRNASPVANVSVRMAIPTGIQNCQAISDNGSTPNLCFVGNDVVWAIGALAGGASRTVQVAFATIASTTTLPNGTTIHATGSASDGSGHQALANTDVVVQGGAPLMLGLTDDADPVQKGDLVEYTLRFGNRSAAAQLETSLVVTLPAGMTPTATGGGVIAGDTVTWAIDTVNAGDGGERRLTVSVDDLAAVDPLVRVIHAEVSSTTAAARASEVTTVAASIPLGLALVAKPDPVDQTDIHTYELTVTNRRPVDAADVQVRLQIPEGMQNCQAFSDGGTAPDLCFSGRDVAWNLGALAQGASRTVSVAFAVAAVGSEPNGTIFHALARAQDGSGGRALAAVSTMAQGGAPLMLGLSDDADPVQVGELVEYTLRFGNRSTAAQLETTLAVTLPAGMTPTPATDGGVVSGNTVTWDVGTVNAGAGGERRLTVSVDDLAAADPLVRVTHAVLSSTAATARASELTTVAASVPLGLVLVAKPDPVDQSDILTYEVTVTNRRPADAADVQVRLQIPEGIQNCQAFSDGGTAPDLCFSGRDVLWNLGALAQGGSRTVSVAFAVAAVASEPNGTIFSATARARDGAGGHARAGVSTIAQSGAPLMLGLTDDADPVQVDDLVEYRLRFGNRSTAAQLGTTLVVTLPAGMTPTAATDGGVVSGDTVTWDIGTVNAGAGGERRLTVSVDDLAAADRLVRVTHAVLSSTTASARARELTTVAESIPLGLVMVARPDPVEQSGILTYELTVTNRREADAADVQVRLQIPEGIQNCQAFSDGGTAPDLCFSGRDVFWNLGALAQGGSRTVSVAFAVAAVASEPNGTIFSATARAQDGAGGRARAGVSTIAQGGAPLMLGLADDVDPVLVDDLVEYTLRFGNRGAAAQLNTTLVATLPAGVTPTATDGGVVAGHTVTWSIGTVNAGSNGERQLTVSVDDLASVDPLVRLMRAAVSNATAAARASELTTVAASVPLDLVMAATPDPVSRNAVLTYELTVTNDGAADAADVQLRMQIPTGVASCQTISDGGTTPDLCFAGRDVFWNLGALAQGASRTVSVVFRTISSATTLPNGTIIHATARVRDGAGASAHADTSTAVFQ